MINPEQIPDEVVKAMSEADHGTTTYAELLAAALQAWPDMQLSCLTVEVPGRKIILPLPQEKQNAK